ncbi:MAG TPA: DUF1552 domain-containing protein [Bryobacteraceae bacterium]|nr:DUF1552 domain-containing protein [Bryobacteraceae bacterium]
MFIAKKHLSRRTLLRGVGASLALPFLDSMVPAQTPLRRTAASSRIRLACIEMVHGAAGSTDEGARKHYWSPGKEGVDFDFSYSLEPLAPFREYITIITGTDAAQAEPATPSEGGADHFRSSAVFLTAAHAKQTPGADVLNGVSIDQLYAQRFGQDTRVPSIQLCIENVGLSDTCGYNYNCIYSQTISWASPTDPLPMTVNPRVVFENLFASAASASGSILDAVGSDVAHLQSRLDAQDRNRLSAYLDDVRGVERRIQAIERHNASAVRRDLPAAPLGVPDSWEQHVKLMFDLQALAFATESTRVSAFKMSRDTSTRIFPESGVKTPFHTLSHHSQKPALIAEFATLNRYHVSLLPYFLQKLRNTPDGDGNLLDHTLILYGSPMGDSNAHNHRRLPLLLAGHAGGQLRGNLHRVCPTGTPHANCLLTILHKLDVDVASIGDSTGQVEI